MFVWKLSGIQTIFFLFYLKSNNQHTDKEKTNIRSVRLRKEVLPIQMNYWIIDKIVKMTNEYFSIWFVSKKTIDMYLKLKNRVVMRFLSVFIDFAVPI